MSKPIRVLQVLHNLKNGGVQRDVVIPIEILDRKNVIFDVLLLSDVHGELEKRLEGKASIYRIPIKRGSNVLARALHVWSNPIRVYRETRKLIRSNGGYDAVHVRHRMFLAPCASAAKKEGVKVRIVHSHVNGPDSRELPHVKAYLNLSKVLCRRNATMLLGVTKDACNYLFGKKANAHVIKNPLIDLTKFDPQRYSYSEHTRINLIQVGSYGERKNQLFSIEIVKELVAKSVDAAMTFIGYAQEGSNVEQRMRETINSYGLQSVIQMLPSDTNVADELAKADIMLLPSLQEGLPNTALEAQAMGVKCLLSSNISTDANYGLCDFLPLDKGAAYWADQIVEYARKSKLRKTFIDLSCYDNRKVCEQHLMIWQGHSFEESLQAFD